MKIGEVISYADLKIIRPEDGLPPSEIDCVVGRKLIKSVKALQSVTGDLFIAKI
jgi:sialic acid synthase SpsE